MFKVATQGVCAKEIIYKIKDQVIEEVQFIGGCPGNALGLSNMVVGQPVEEVVNRLKDVKCGNRPTSCPAQLALALQNHL